MKRQPVAQHLRLSFCGITVKLGSFRLSDMENGMSSRVKFTYEDYLLFPDDGKSHKLIDGEHFVMPSPTTKHQRVSVKLLNALENFLGQNRLAEVFTAP